MRLKKIIRKIKRLNSTYFNKLKYINYYREIEIKPNVIFLEAQNANNFNGNIYYLAKELNDNKEYEKYEIFFSINKQKYKMAKNFFKSKNLDNIKLVQSKTKKYYELLASAKYLFTDTSFTPDFIKKEGQIIFNTWHGTPLKTLGKKVNNDFDNIGNIQKNFIIADYLLYPNEYMMNHMIEDYMFSNLSEAKILLEGYPRNQVFFDEELKKNIREQHNLQNKQVLIYMPTWRGSVSRVKNQKQQIILEDYLYDIDGKLNKNQVLYVNLHPFLNEIIDYSKFKNIKKFPKEYETYEFVSIADCLITDYSSVFFDFATTGKKIILFTYDEAEYLEERGLYISLDELPFPKVSNIKDLIYEINTPKQYDDKGFIKEYCKYDNKDVSKKLCAKIILNKEENLLVKNLEKNGKDNILIYPGNLVANGITTSLLNLLQIIDLDKNNYFVTFDTAKVSKHKKILKRLPEKVNYIPIKGKMNLNFSKKVFLFLYKKKIINEETYLKHMKDEFKDEVKRVYGNAEFSTVIQFNGYDYKKILLYSVMDANRIIYVHNDMYKEATEKQNVGIQVLKYAYKEYDKIALVTKDLIEPTCKIENVKEKYYIVNNLINYKHVLAGAKKEVKFDETTESNITEEQLKEILNSENKKFINIGRFSKEKGQERLIDAFEKLWEKDKSIYLIIVGGYGKEYNKILKKVEKINCKEHIIVIKYVSNPYPIIKKCDYFVLSSFYEGFGLVLAEADILGKPVISTNITGTRIFMEEHKGKLVENSTEGIYKGMKLLLDGKVKPMNVDYEKYNQEAVQQFERLLSKGK